jgi:hypothetical protein
LLRRGTIRKGWMMRDMYLPKSYITCKDSCLFLTDGKVQDPGAEARIR